MTTPDYKSLCAELLGALEEEASNWNLDPAEHPLVDRARAALAAELVSEPYKSAPGGPTMPAAINDMPEAQRSWYALGWRAAISRWETPNLAQVRSSLGDGPQPVPEGPTDEELLEWASSSDSPVPEECLDPDMGDWQRCFTSEEFCATVRAALEEWGTPNLAQTRSSLGDGPAVPESREPASVNQDPTDKDIMALMPPQMHEDLAAAARAMAGYDSPKAAMGAIRNILNCHAIDHARAVLARWGHTPNA